jgi:hypothetical protein
MRIESRVMQFWQDARTLPVYVVGVVLIAFWIRAYQLYVPIIAHWWNVNPTIHELTSWWN